MATRALGLAAIAACRFALAAALLFAPAAGAARASAATIRSTSPCYVTTSLKQRAQMTVVGSGFVPVDDNVLLQSG